MKDLYWHDLLAARWRLHGGSIEEGFDCSSLAEEVLRRAGFSPSETSPFRRKNSHGELGEMDDYFSSVSQAYDNIGDDITLATEVGDLVLCRTSGGFAGHLFVLVDPSTGTFLTACHDRGVVAVRRSLVKSVVGVYRCLKKA